jgi:hypothetical protein
VRSGARSFLFVVGLAIEPLHPFRRRKDEQRNHPDHYQKDEHKTYQCHGIDSHGSGYCGGVVNALKGTENHLKTSFFIEKRIGNLLPTKQSSY